MSAPLSFHRGMFGQKDERPALSMPLPIVYENVPVTPTSWEYDVLTVDTREAHLPDAALLNEKGSQGWLLAGVLEQKTGDGTRFVHYYFVRQKAE